MKKIILSSILLLFISCNSKYPLGLGDGFTLDYNSNNYMSVYNNKNSIVVYGDVLKYASNDDFIIVHIKPIDVIEKNLDTNHVKDYQTRENEIKISKLRQYWIIDKKKLTSGNPVKFGPFNEADFKNESEELKIPDNLVLKDI